MIYSGNKIVNGKIETVFNGSNGSGGDGEGGAI